MSMLERLKCQAEAIRFSEFATLIHDIDKSDLQFLNDSHWHSKGKGERGNRWLEYKFPDVSVGLEALDCAQLRSAHAGTTIVSPTILGISDPFVFHHHNNKVSDQPFLSHIVHGGLGGADGLDSALDKDVPTTNADGSLNVQTDRFCIDTPFGCLESECEINIDRIQDLIGRKLAAMEDTAGDWLDVVDDLKPLMKQCLGETRFPCNDVTLWAHSYSVATLAKALLAKVILEYPERPPNQPYLMPGRHHKFAANRTDFAFCRVAFDRDYLWSRAQKVGDLVGIGDQIVRLQEVTRAFVGEELLFGNEVARFQDNQLFLMPNLGTWVENSQPVLRINLQQEFEEEVREALTGFIVDWLGQNSLEDLPFAIDFEHNADGDKAEVTDRILARSRMLLGRPAVCRQSAAALAKLRPSGLRCEVCGVRGIGNGAEPALQKATSDEKLCGPCWRRRHDSRMLKRRNISEELVTSDLGGLLRGGSGNKLALIYVGFDQSLLDSGDAFEKVTWEGNKDSKLQTFKKHASLGRLDRCRDTMAGFLTDVGEGYERFLLTLEATSDYTAFIVSGDAIGGGSGGLLAKIHDEYERRFGKFRDVLPLSVGVVFFYQKFPLYVVVDVMRSMRESLVPGDPVTYTLQVSGYSEGGEIAEMVLDGGDCSARGKLSAPAIWKVPSQLSNGAYDPYHPQFGAKRLKNMVPGDAVPAREGRFDFVLAESAQTRYAFDGCARRHHVFGERPPYVLSAIPQFERLQYLLSKLAHSQVSQIEGLLTEKILSWGSAWWKAENDDVVRGFCRVIIMSPNAFGNCNTHGRYACLGEDQAGDEELLLNAARNGMLLDAIDLYYHMLNSARTETRAAANERG